MSAMEKIIPTLKIADSIHIDPDALYRPEHLREVLGARCVNHLNKAGLRAVGGWYFGESILAACRIVWHNDPVNQRVPESRKEESIETEHAAKATKTKVEKALPKRVVQPVPKPKATESLQCQLEAFKRKVRPQAV